MNVIAVGTRVPVKTWCDYVEDGALNQVINLANHPCTFRHVALMPDCHQGYGMPIGGVVALKNAVSPNFVGVDIGCGVIAVRTTVLAKEVTTDQIKAIMGTIRKLVPVGFDHQKDRQEWDGFKDCPNNAVVTRELVSASKQLGTLGGGNHFIELQAGSDGFLWAMVHSGSRNFGYKIAKHYNAEAQRLCDMFHSDIPESKGDDGVAFLPIGTVEAREYIEAMNYALRFAQENRERIMIHVIFAIYAELECEFDEPINIHHNFAKQEHHFGKDVWVHRKGATQAYAGQKGIIPGSMGTSSYIVEGLGNPESFMSCSHGAGRCMGRKEASRTLTVEECDKAMEGIVYGRWGQDRKGNVDLGEAPQAYKDIDAVMEAQQDLVKILVKLRPLGVIKG